MFPVICHALIPAENPARAGQALNILLVTENATDQAFTAPVALWGSLGGPWRELLQEEREFPAHSHPHLYFTIPAQRLSPDFWDGQEVDELALAAGETAPDPQEPGVLVFFA